MSPGRTNPRLAPIVAGRRGVVLVAVLLVIVLASLVGTTVLIVADADRAGAEVTLHRTQSRALAWSGVQAAMAELASQREDILDGKRPRVTEEWTLVGGDGAGARGVFRLVALAEDGPLVSESAKLNVNTATPEMLARIPGIGPELAKRIVTARDASPLAGVESLLEVEGVGPELLYGPAAGEKEGPSAARHSTLTPLADLLTVFSFDPNVQLGLGGRGEGHRGELRLNINTPWSERLERALAKRFDQDFAGGVKSIMEQRKFSKDSDIVAALNAFNVEPKEWAESLDVFTTSPDPYLVGKVDLNTAPIEVLACVPGIDEAAAGRIVGMRGRMEEEALKSVAWPAAEGVLTPEQFQAAADHLTTRSMQWRVRVEAGLEVTDPTGGREDSLSSEAPKLRDRIVLEAVIDVSSERARVAYLRDVTLLDLACEAYAASGVTEEPEEANRAVPGPEAADEQGADAQGPSRPSRLEQESLRVTAAERQREERRGPDRSAEQESEVAPPPSEPSPAAPAADTTEAGQDRRIGRWSPAGGSQGGRR